MQQDTRVIWAVVIVVIVLVGGYLFFNKSDDRAMNERIGDAISNMDARELQNRTPAERMGDAINDATN